MKSSSNKFSSLAQRVPTAIVGAIIIIGGTYFSMWSYFTVFLLLSIFTQLEFYKLARLDDKLPLKYWGTFIGSSFFVFTFLVEAEVLPLKYFLFVFPLLTSVFLVKLYKKNEEKPFTNVAFTYLGIIYVAIPFSLLNVLVFSTDIYSYQIIIGTMLIIWASDTGAFFAGIAMGRKKLFKRISPKKTWEGSVGGGVVALAMAWAVSMFFGDLFLWQWLTASVIIVIAGTYGDLVESLFKRSIEIKDSGSAIPGHGGFLDRFDSLLLASPFIVIFIKFF